MISRRFLLDQMLDLDVAQILRNAGHDVIRVSDVGLATADDYAILRRAIDDDRVLLTLDEHFGDWAVLPLSQHPGVVRIKADPTTTSQVVSVLIPFLLGTSDRDYSNQLIIIRPTGSRWIRTISGQ
jgi:predicted nuclease of predicted toxin-antitoxin system